MLSTEVADCMSVDANMTSEGNFPDIVTFTDVWCHQLPEPDEATIKGKDGCPRGCRVEVA
jgi:hypothetical protein